MPADSIAPAVSPPFQALHPRNSRAPRNAQSDQARAQQPAGRRDEGDDWDSTERRFLRRRT